MNDLPTGLLEPLHLLAPTPWRALLALLALLLAIWLWRRQRRRRAAPPPPSPVPSPVPAAAGGLRSVVGALRRRFDRQRDYRAGCHALAAALRRHLERKGHRLLALTADEIAAVVETPAVGSLFRLLADLQWRRREPSRSDFVGACELVLDTVDHGPERER